MQNIVLLKKNKETMELSRNLGFKETLFLDEDLIYFTGGSRKEALNKIKEAQKQKLLIIYRPETEEMLRFVLEKTTANIICGIEEIHQKDSVHFPRGGLDQILCKIAAEKGKIIAFSFSEILHSKEKAKLLRRIMFNLKLCRKYKVKTIFSNFSRQEEEMRSQKDLAAFSRVLNSYS